MEADCMFYLILNPALQSPAMNMLSENSYFYFLFPAGVCFATIRRSLWSLQISPPTHRSFASKRRRSRGFQWTTSTTSTTWSFSGCPLIHWSHWASTASGVFTTWTSSGWMATPSPPSPGSLWPTCQTWGSSTCTTTRSLSSLRKPPSTSRISPIWTYPATAWRPFPLTFSQCGWAWSHPRTQIPPN